MSTTYEVRAGDTFEIISRRRYGTELETRRIIEANPGVSEPLQAGTIITIPPLNLTDTTAATAASTPDEVAVIINGSAFRFWDSVTITRAMDEVDTVSLSAPFDPDGPGYRDAFRPLSFQNLDVKVGGAPLFTGIMLNVNPGLGAKRRDISVDGYSRPGVLNDCTPFASSFPLEFNSQNLFQIAAAIARPFNIDVVFIGSPGPAFERAACASNKKALDFLTTLAKQRGYVISSTETGELLFWPTAQQEPVTIRLAEGAAPLLSVEPQFNPQDYYSHVTGIEPVIVGLPGSKYTVRNPRLTGVLRPHTFNAGDTVNSSLKRAVEAKAGRMFSNFAAYSVSVATWRDPSGELWQPRRRVKLFAPGAMVYNEYEFIIRSVDFEKTPNSQTATLNLIIPGSLVGLLPEVLPWDG